MPPRRSWQGRSNRSGSARLGASSGTCARAQAIPLRVAHSPCAATARRVARGLRRSSTLSSVRARAVLSLLLRLKPRATRLAVAAQGAWATLCAIACALAQVPLDAPNLAEPEPLDLPCHDRIGGAATLQRLMLAPE